MKKDTYYFGHDYNSRSDVKIKKMIMKHGMVSYGIFWAIIEDLYQNANALQPHYELLAFEYRVDTELIKSILHDFDLFIFNGENFKSLSIERRLNDREEKSLKAKQSASLRWNKNKDNANALQSHTSRNAIKEKKGKEKKGKESKGNYINEINENENFVFKINSEKIYTSPSNWLKEFAQSYVDNLMMKCSLTLEEKTRLLSDVYKRMDSEYSYYDFNNHNHVKNAFKGILDKLMLTEKTNYNKLSVNGSSTF